jgi:uncharacterized membrane protein YbhN (UPF0104 family)
MARSWIGAIVALTILALAGFLLARTLGRYDLEEVGSALRQIGARQLAGAAAFAAASYLALTAIDAMAVRYAGARLPYRHVAFASFIALSLGHSLGFAALSSGAVRFRFYRRWGLGVGEIARVILFCGLTVTLGYALLGGIVLTTSADWLGALIGAPPGGLRLAGVLALAIPVLFLCAVYLGRPIRLRSVIIAPPPPHLAIGQILIGCLDVALVTAVLHQCLGGEVALPYAKVLAVYIAAAVAGMLAHAPGGLGVVEAVTLALLPGADTIAGLLAFRAVYYLVPLALGGAALAAFELSAGRRAPAG